MRLIQTSFKKRNQYKNFTIYGEVDKSGDAHYSEIIPDFIFHIPGTRKNYVVAEVKVQWEIRGIRKDFETLRKMINQHDYECGVFLLIGCDMSEITRSKIDKIYNSVSGLSLVDDKIYVLTQKYHDDNSSKICVKKLSEIRQGIGHCNT